MELTREELIIRITALGLHESFLETFLTEELRDAHNSHDRAYKYLTALAEARNNN